jgi:hypothetical protein
MRSWADPCSAQMFEPGSYSSQTSQLYKQRNDIRINWYFLNNRSPLRTMPPP